MVEFRIDDKIPQIVEIFHDFSSQRKSTSEADYETAQIAIRQLYTLNNYRPPNKFFYAKSPVEAEIISKIFCTSCEEDLMPHFWQEAEESLSSQSIKWNDFDDGLYLNLWALLDENYMDVPIFEIDSFLIQNDKAKFDNVWDKTLNTYWDYTRPQNWKIPSADLLKQKIHFTSTNFHGLFDYDWMLAECARRIGVPFEDKAKKMLSCINEILYSCGSVYLYEDFAIICDRPEIIYCNANGRLHNENGMALSFSDGCGVYAINGINFPEHVVMRPHEITKKEIYKEKNVEARRIMIERVGAQKFVSFFNAKVVHEDMDQLRNSRRLLKVEMMEGDWFAIEVTDSSITKDVNGNWRNKKYYLSINPKHYNGRAGRECQAAIASTWRHGYDNTKLFFKKPEDYRPVVET